MKGGRRKKAGRAVLAAVLAAVAVSGVRLWRPGAGTGGNLPEGSYLREQAALACFSFLWGGHYPAAGEEMDISLTEGILAALPAYRLGRERLEAERRAAGKDPAFAAYLENQKFFAEYGDFSLKNDGSGDAAGGAAGSGDGGGGERENSAGYAKPEAGGETAEAAALSGMDGLPVTGQVYTLSQLADYDFLMKTFYSVHPSTTAGREDMNAEELLSEDLRLTGGSDSPQILIYHSHSQETYADWGPNQPEATVVGVGEYLTELLREKGYNVIHDTSVYDLRNGTLDRSKAYTYALEGITAILQENPSIEVVLDLHRDGVDENNRLVEEVNGKPTAQIMFFNGMSQTPDGPIEYLPNPYRKDNLAFSLQLQVKAAAYFPGLTRKIYLKGLRYNLHVRPRSSLIEVGAQNNTYEEARNAMEPLAELLDMVLQGN